MRFRWCHALAAVAAAVPAGVEGQAPATAFTHVSVLPMDRERVLDDQTVVVQGGHIVAMGSAQRVQVPAGATTVDGHGKFLMPGLADMHMHLDWDSAALADTAGLKAKLMLYVANGITTIRNMHGQPIYVALRERAAKGELISPRIYTAGPGLFSYSHGNMTPAQAKQLVADYKTAGYDFIKIHFDQGQQDFSAETFDTLTAAAHRAGIPFAGHTPPQGLERMLRARPAVIEHLSSYWLYLAGQDTATTKDWYSDAEGRIALVPDESKIARLVKLTKDNGVWNCPTQLITKTGAPDRDKGPERVVIAERKKIIRALYDGGAGLLLGTDGGPAGVYNNPMMQSPGFPPASEVPLELGLLVEAGLTPYAALETATKNPALFLGAADTAGTVAVGKRADLILLNGNPLADLHQTAHPAGTMLGGRWFPRDELITRLKATSLPAEWYH